MRFHLIDRITELQPGKLLRAYKNLALGEEYLADHFPGFPVMPGVLMLQTLVEAGSWLLRITDDYAHSVIVLREVKNVKYGTFMEPGKRMQLCVELVEQNDAVCTCKGKGDVGGQSTVTAKFTLGRYNLKERDPALASSDEQRVQELRRHARLLLAKGAA
ncbi:3-hydroxyacyl-ACP dehydratase FabZ family protein [soil metagenome]